MQQQKPHPHKEHATAIDDIESLMQQQEPHLHGDIEPSMQQKLYACKKDINAANDMEPPPHKEHVYVDDTQPSSFAAEKVGRINIVTLL